MHAFESGVTAVIALLAGALVVGVFAERLRLPYSVMLLLAGLPLKLPHATELFGPTLLFVYLPALVFEAAWNIDAVALRRRWLPVLVLAVPGVVMTAAFVGLGLSLLGLLPFLPAFLLGSILAATDPIIVSTVFRQTAVPEGLAVIVEGESLLNDGAAIALYSVVLAATAAGDTVLHPNAIASQTLVVAVGGSALGLIGAVVVSALITLVLPKSADVMLQVVGTVVAAYGGYLIAERFHVSGIFAAVVAGVALRAFKRFPTTEAAGSAIQFFWGAIAFFANSLVFLGMGLAFEFGRIVREPALVLLTLALVTTARIILAYVVLPLPPLNIHHRAWQHVVALSGMRGALSVALALGLPQTLPHRAEIIDAVFGVVFITLVTQGLSIGPVIGRLRLAQA